MGLPAHVTSHWCGACSGAGCQQQAALVPLYHTLGSVISSVTCHEARRYPLFSGTHVRLVSAGEKRVPGAFVGLGELGREFGSIKEILLQVCVCHEGLFDAVAVQACPAG